MYEFALLAHVLGATLWTGGHLVLACSILPMVLRSRDVTFLQRFESAYEKVGIPALIVQILSGLYLAAHYLPDLAALGNRSNPAANLVLIKLGLLLATAVLAADARLRIIPRLGEHNLKALAWHVYPVTVIAVLFALTGVVFRFGWLA
ncbi:MAG TPA: CopD family protein [Pseudomonas sp.]|jgi:putative copper export protein|nr:CopD family protein [Pseudomonas sp.]